METAYWPEGVSEVAQANKKKKFFKSRFLFLNEHNGFRPGNLHVFLGVSGGGKSTLTRSILSDILYFSEEKENVLLWLSEETIYDFKTDFSLTSPGEKAKQLKIISEQDLEAEKNPLKKIDTKSPRDLLQYIKTMCIEEEIKILIFDNITTSGIYDDKHYSVQAEVTTALKQLAADLRIPILIYAHTASSIKTNMIDQSDVRGNRGLANKAPFFYVMQQFMMNEVPFSTIRIVKFRSQDPDHKLYQLIYNKSNRMYGKDIRLDFKEFKKRFKERDSL